MDEQLNQQRNYRIEVSGWGLDNTFFVEMTNLHWLQDGGKQVRMHRALFEGAIVFVRLLSPESLRCSLPVAYRVDGVKPMDSIGQCEMHLEQLRPRTKAPNAAIAASYCIEDLLSTCEPRENSMQPEPEEVLQ